MPSAERRGVERPVINVAAPTGGWPDPWPNVAEIAAVLPADKWTLVGGLMTQLHSIHHGLGIVRPTNDVDIVLHIETSRNVSRAAHRHCDAPSTRGWRSSLEPAPPSRCPAGSAR